MSDGTDKQCLSVILPLRAIPAKQPAPRITNEGTPKAVFHQRNHHVILREPQDDIHVLSRENGKEPALMYTELWFAALDETLIRPAAGDCANIRDIA
jgi:hypothetical protein